MMFEILMYFIKKLLIILGILGLGIGIGYLASGKSYSEGVEDGIRMTKLVYETEVTPVKP